MIPRYETPAMRALWQEEAKLVRWTQVELAVCRVQYRRGLIPEADMRSIEACAQPPSPTQVAQIEHTTHHDVVAFVQAWTRPMGAAGRHIHRGLTSSDVVDTALAMALRDSLDIVLAATQDLHQVIAHLARTFKQTPCVGRTHGMHAEPTTLGWRFAGWCTELARHTHRLQEAQKQIAYGKLSGAVGTFSQTDPCMEQEALEHLGLRAEPVATQIIPRDRHAGVISTFSLLGAGLERFATEIRHLQRTEIQEVQEPFHAGQTGSSAMPHKRNPVVCERLVGMARLLRGYQTCALENIALWHDRDISHSSVERVMFPDACHLMHAMLLQLTEVMLHIHVDPDAMLENLNKTRGLIFSQKVLDALLSKGLDRQHAYAAVQAAAACVWDHQSPDFLTALRANPTVQACLSEAELQGALDLQASTHHLGTLMARAGL